MIQGIPFAAYALAALSGLALEPPSARAAQPGRIGACIYDESGTVFHVPVTGAPTAPAAKGGDPDVEPGFPVQGPHVAGSYHSGPAIHTLVGNIDADPQLEIVRTALATGPLFAWNHDGSRVSGWPVTAVPGAGNVALGDLSASSAGLEVFSGHYDTLAAWTGNGSSVPGWPRASTNGVATPPALADVTGDGVPEIFIEEEDYGFHAYDAAGAPLAGWPVYAFLGSQERHTPALADLDGDGDLEVLTVTGWATGGAYLLAYHHDGATVSGFPILLPGTYADTFPVVGDVDGDGALEIVMVIPDPANPSNSAVRILSSSGAPERLIPASTGTAYGSVPALADLDEDGTLDIVVQTDEGLYAWKGDGTPLPGWPRIWSFRWLGSSSPVVGDVTGDGHPDIVVTIQTPGSGTTGEVRVYDRKGVLHPRFPKTLAIGAGAVPAIADIDLDGRNEIVISGQYWSGVPGNYDMVWAYDLGGVRDGPVLWGQFMGNAAHTGNAGLIPAALAVDTGGNGVFEVGEIAVVSPAWRNFATRTLSLQGSVSLFTGPPGATYSTVDGMADYGNVPDGTTGSCSATGDCYSVSVSPSGGRPAPHWDGIFEEQLRGGELGSRRWALHVGESFTDVLRTSPFYRHIETLLHHGVTGGCGTGAYCPVSSTTRDQMAVFVLVAKEGAGYVPPACGTPVFTDVPASSGFCPFIEELARRGVTSGCGGGNYCPTAAVSREQMAVFVLRTLDPALSPPACTTPIFNDVPASSPFCRWIEELARRGVVGGCGGGNYCPTAAVTREQMAVFLTGTFGLTLYGP